MGMMLRAAAAAVALLLGACMGLDPSRIAPGTPGTQVIGSVGEPTGRLALPGGAERLEYARGPYGKHTWFIDLDAAGRVTTVTQALTEPRFNAIRAGMTGDEVRAAIGRPSETYVLNLQKQTVWAYRYETPFCQWFQVGIDRASGRVVDSAYGPDPLCQDNADDRSSP